MDNTTHQNDNVGTEIEEDAGVVSRPMLHHPQPIGVGRVRRPSDIAEQIMYLFVRVHGRGNILAEKGWEVDGHDDEGHHARVDETAARGEEKRGLCPSKQTKQNKDSLVVEHSVQAFVFAKKVNNLSMCLHKQSPTKARHDADEGERNQLLRIERKVRAKVCFEQSGDCLLVAKPNSKQSPHGGATARRKEATPIVAHGKEDRCYLDREENATDRRVEGGGHADGARRRQHFGRL